MVRGLSFVVTQVQGLYYSSTPGSLRRRQLSAVPAFAYAWGGASKLPPAPTRLLLRWAERLFDDNFSRFTWPAVATLLNLAAGPRTLSLLRPAQHFLATAFVPAGLKEFAAYEPAWVYTQPRRYVLGHWVTALGNMGGACAFSRTSLHPAPLFVLHSACSAVILFY